MKNPLFCLLLSMLSLSTSAQALYPFKHGDRWGFIDKSGREQIPADYRGVGRFSEGLAAVRLRGTYGYINESGQLTIPFRFDYAEPFLGGVAIAYLKGKPYLIDKSGARLFHHNFSAIEASGQPRLWIVQSQNKKFGLVNQSGNLILDTIYSGIDRFLNGKAVVHKEYGTRKEDDFKRQAAIVNTKGNFLLPFGTYADLSALRDGYFVASYQRDKDGYEKHPVLIDPKGKPVFSIASEEWYLDAEEFRATQSPISILVKHHDGDGYSVDSYSGVVDNKGALLFSDSSWDQMTPFTLNRAFVKIKSDEMRYENNWIMIDKRGRRVGNRIFSQVYGVDLQSADEQNDIFQNSMAFVQTTDDRWGAIDTNGKYVIGPIDLDSATGGESIRIANRVGDILILSEDISTKSETWSYRYGFWDTRQRILVRPQYYDLAIDTPGALIRVLTQDQKLAYIDGTGALKWKESGPSLSNQTMDIDYLNRGYFRASGLKREDLAGYGGWGGSDNSAKSFQSDVPYKHNDLSIFISNTSKPWSNICQGQKVYVVNASHDTLYFPAQDSRLYMNVQAMDADGSWKDIEYLPGSWCGNSYHTLALSPKQYWDFVMPVYDGEMKTKLRVKLVYRYTSKLYEGNDNEVMYSNVVDGNINPAQFWRKREYYPAGLMDPYED